jgi:hypothetical protein
MKRIAGILGVPSRSDLGEGRVDIAALEYIDVGLAGVIEDCQEGMRSESPEPPAGRLIRRSRTAKASRISRHAVKSRCARERDGWGRLSGDGPGEPGPERGPLGWRVPTLQAVHDRVLRADSERTIVATTRCTKGEDKSAVSRRMPGAGLS